MLSLWKRCRALSILGKTILNFEDISIKASIFFINRAISLLDYKIVGYYNENVIKIWGLRVLIKE